MESRFLPSFQTSGRSTIPLWCEKGDAARHCTVIGKQLLITNDWNSLRWAVLGLSGDGACTDLFENLCVNSFKGDLLNACNFNPPLFSTVNTFKFRYIHDAGHSLSFLTGLMTAPPLPRGCRTCRQNINRRPDRRPSRPSAPPPYSLRKSLRPVRSCRPVRPRGWFCTTTCWRMRTTAGSSGRMWRPPLLRKQPKSSTFLLQPILPGIRIFPSRI